MQSKSKRKAPYDFLPPHIGDSFLTELTTIISNLSDEPKNNYLRQEVFSKFLDPTIVSPEVRRSEAIKKWLAVDARNAKTNVRIDILPTDFGFASSDDIINRCKRKIKRVLGPVKFDMILSGLCHTNGASSRISRSPVARIEKHEGKAHVTSSALKYWLEFASSTRFSDQDLEIRESSVLFTVDKKSDIDRVACKEPEINVLLQRGAGQYIAKRLKYVGINLRDQGINRRLAKRAYLDGNATIDLSSASDSISEALVRALLPRDWFFFLDDLRCKYVDIDGLIYRPNMFSSAGNGFTFELESLIFWALTTSIMEISGKTGGVSVFGDDIIAPCSIARRIGRIFSWFGFTVNPKKSFWNGPFRESCGGHYYGGRDISPFYVKGHIRRKTHMIKYLNKLLWWDSRGFRCFTTPEVAAFHFKWSLQIPRALWGGQRTDDITSLVTGHQPYSRIAWKTKKERFCEEAGLNSWFLSNETLTTLSPLDPSSLGTSIKDDVEPFFDRRSPLYDSGSLGYWDPYLVYGPFLQNHTSL